MTASELINATNLAKLRAARVILDDLEEHGPLSDDDLRAAKRLFSKMENDVSGFVVCDDDDT